MLLSRDEFVTALFRETDRAQRMKTPLSVMYFGIGSSENRVSRSDESVADEFVGHFARVLRCYDSVGCMGRGEYALMLPGCTARDAMSLAERLKMDETATPVVVHGAQIRLTACFGVAASGGRSPLVVLKEAEQAFRSAAARGAGSIEFAKTTGDADIAGFLESVFRGR